MPTLPLLTPEEFTRRLVGAPWRRWASDWTACDCFGALTLYFREVLGVDLGPVPQTDIEAGFLQARGWAECDRAGAQAWMVWRQGSPVHCGLVLPDGQYLHSEGTPERPGSVRVSRPEALARVYGGEIRFYRYTPC